MHPTAAKVQERLRERGLDVEVVDLPESRDVREQGRDEHRHQDRPIPLRDVQVRPQHVQAPTARRARERAGEGGPAEPHRGSLHNMPPVRADDDGLARGVAEIEDQSALVGGDPQMQCLPVLALRLALQHRARIGQRATCAGRPRRSRSCSADHN